MTYLNLAYIHLATVIPAFLLGAYIIFTTKGTATHKLLGKIYGALMLFTAVITLFMSAQVGPQFLGHFGYIHLFSALILWSIPTAVMAIRRGNVKAHKRKMLLAYFGSMFIAGGFAFTEGRLLNQWLFG